MLLDLTTSYEGIDVSDKPIVHTNSPWFSGHNDAPEPEYLVSWPETGAMIALVPRQGDSSLIAMAPAAPHVCHYPQCPGDINRRKLELWDALVMQLRLRLQDYWMTDESRADAKEILRRAMEIE